MRGILGWGAYLPYRRLDRTTIAAVAGQGGGTGSRTVASYDEDTTTLAVAAARHALHSTHVLPQILWFATTAPSYLDKTNATTIHAALRLDRDTAAYDAIGSMRSTAGALRAATTASGPVLVTAADIRTGRPGSPDETTGGDAGAAVLVGSDADAPVVAEILGWTSVTEEFLDRWRVPGEAASRRWEERFGEARYAELSTDAWKRALDDAGLDAAAIDVLVVASLHDRAASRFIKQSGVAAANVADRLSASVGCTGAAEPLLLLASTLDDATPGQRIALVVLADGVDVVLLRTTDAIADHQPGRPVAAQIAAGGSVSYGTFLAWRGFLPVEPPRRPEPSRPSGPAASRSRDWKYGFVGSESDAGDVHLPPSPDDTVVRPMADATGTVVTFTVDRLAYSPSPPVVFAVVDFDGGGRLPVELTDCDADDVRIGARVELTFRRLFVSDGVHNYFWKASLVRDGDG